MKWEGKKMRVERYAAVWKKCEQKWEEWLREWSDWLQAKSDQLSIKTKYILFMILCIGVSCLCAMIIINALK